jgi:ABC-type transport system substrate-binding protein
MRRAIAVAAALWLAAATCFAADLGKTLRVSFPVGETGFDPAASNDLYSNQINRVIFDPLYSYSYLARPYTIAPNTAAALPDISADGKTWTIKVKPGIFFADDAAIKGKKPATSLLGSNEKPPFSSIKISFSATFHDM